MRLPTATAALALAALVLAAIIDPSPALGEQPAARVALDWDAPAACPDRAAVERQLAARLGRALDAQDAQVEAAARVHAVDAGYRLELSIRAGEASGTRTLSSNACAELASATALILALTIDPETVAAAELDALEATPGTESSASSQTNAQAEPETQPDERETTAARDARQDDDADTEEARDEAPSEPLELGAVVRAGVLADAGALPSGGLGPMLEAGLALGMLELTVLGLWLPPQDVDGTARADRVGSLQLAAAGPSACLSLTRERPRLQPCLALAYGSVWGEGVGITDGQRGDARWLEAALRLRAELDLTPWLSLGAELGAALPLIRTAFRVEGHGEVHAPQAVAARLGFGLAVRP